MTPGPKPQWLEDAIKAATLMAKAASEQDQRFRKSADASKPSMIGPAVAEPELGSGRYYVALRGRKYDVDKVETAFLAPESGSQEMKYTVIEAMVDGGVIRIRAAEHAPPDGLVLYAQQLPGGRLDQALLDGLQKLTPGPLTESFARATLTAIRPRVGAPGGLNAGQAAGWAAGTQPGLNAVWGPPGTGKTAVIARVIEDLIERGKSVLLVSGTNVAVDNAVFRAAKDMPGLRPGLMLRVGTPHVPDVANDERICLSRLQDVRLAALNERAAVLSAQIAETREHPDLRRLGEAEGLLANFDLAEYRGICDQIAQWGRAEQFRQLLRELASRQLAAIDGREKAEGSRPRRRRRGNRPRSRRNGGNRPNGWSRSSGPTY